MQLKQNYQAYELCSAPPKWSTQVSNLRPQSLHSSLKQRRQTSWQPQSERWKAAGSVGGGGGGEVERDKCKRHWYRESLSDPGDKKQQNCRLDAWKAVARLRCKDWVCELQISYLKHLSKIHEKKNFLITALKSSSRFKPFSFVDSTSSSSSSPALCIAAPLLRLRDRTKATSNAGLTHQTTWARDAERQLAKPRRTLSRWVKRDHLRAGDNTEER